MLSNLLDTHRGCAEERRAGSRARGVCAANGVLGGVRAGTAGVGAGAAVGAVPRRHRHLHQSASADAARPC